MNEKDLRIIQMTLGYAEDVIRKIADANGITPCDLEKNGYKSISDAFYSMNTCWLNIQRKLIVKEEE